MDMTRYAKFQIGMVPYYFFNVGNHSIKQKFQFNQNMCFSGGKNNLLYLDNTYPQFSTISLYLNCLKIPKLFCSKD